MRTQMGKVVWSTRVVPNIHLGKRHPRLDLTIGLVSRVNELDQILSDFKLLLMVDLIRGALISVSSSLDKY